MTVFWEEVWRLMDEALGIAYLQAQGECISICWARPPTQPDREKESRPLGKPMFVEDLFPVQGRNDL